MVNGCAMAKDNPISRTSVQTDALRRKLQADGLLVLDVKVIPRAPCAEVAEWMANGALKVKVTAAPEKGKANEEVCALLAEYWGVPKRNVQVVLGKTSQSKRLKVLL